MNMSYSDYTTHKTINGEITTEEQIDNRNGFYSVWFDECKFKSVDALLGRKLIIKLFLSRYDVASRVSINYDPSSSLVQLRFFICPKYSAEIAHHDPIVERVLDDIHEYALSHSISLIDRKYKKISKLKLSEKKQIALGDLGLLRGEDLHVICQQAYAAVLEYDLGL